MMKRLQNFKTTKPTDENALDFLYNEFTCNVVEFKTIDKVLEKAYISSKLKKQGFNIGIIEDVMTYNDKEYSLIKK